MTSKKTKEEDSLDLVDRGDMGTAQASEGREVRANFPRGLGAGCVGTVAGKPLPREPSNNK